jgi:uncharacterized protein
MFASLLLAALVLGLAGGAHCLAMCGGVCSAFGIPSSGQVSTHRFSVLGLHTGRILAYLALGAFAGGLVEGMAWASEFVMLVKPLWAVLHAFMFAWGILLVLSARQPVWLQRVTSPVVHRIHWARASPWRSGFVGLHWVFLPCGLLYSALLLAGLTGSAWQGAFVMLAFVLPTMLWLLSMPLLFKSARWGSVWMQAQMRRLVGLVLAMGAAWALWQYASHGMRIIC